MNKAITNYEELIEEQQKMKELLQVQKLQIKKDVIELKQELRPALNVISFIGKFALPDARNNGAVKLGTSVTIDWILKKVLASSNPLLRLVVPALVKNYSSHYTDKALPFLMKIKDKLLSKRNKAIRE